MARMKNTGGLFDFETHVLLHALSLLLGFHYHLNQMIGAPTFLDRVEFWRPPGALKRETKVLFLVLVQT